MKFSPLRLALLGAATSLVLAACGGGSDGAITPPPPSPSPAGELALLQFSAVGSSSHTVNLSWAPAAIDSSYAVERKTADGPYIEVGRVQGRSGQYLDDGLNKRTAYGYRVVATDASRKTLAEGQVSTSDEDGIVTAPGAALGEAVRSTLDAAGGQLVSDDGRITVALPAGAVAAPLQAELQAVHNTAPDGLGDGLRVKLSALPTQALALKLVADEGPVDELGNLRIAVQRADGAWFSLPLTALDKATRTLQAELPLQLLVAPAQARRQAVGQAVAEVSIEFTIVKYLGFKLSPASARVPVKGALALVPTARVRGYETQIGTCVHLDDTTEACIFQPMMETRQINLLNTKAGYTRQWLVNLSAGGSPGEGSVAANGDVGATYRAPNTVPDPDTVRVSFTSSPQAGGQTLVLSSLVTIYDERWHGTIKTINGPSDAGTTHIAIARATWTLDAAASTETRQVYRPEGTVEVMVTDDNCTVTVTPSTAPVSTDTRLVELVVDESRHPASYTLKLITFWTATLAAACPGGADTQSTRNAGYGWALSGDLSADGHTMEGFEFGADGERIDWRFTR
jgi:hypothetical protein